MESFFYNTFGYIEYPIEKINIIDDFEKDITLALDGKTERYPNLRNSNFTNEKIYNIFYNKNLLEFIKQVIGDFIVLSPIESFYLNNSNIHRDFCSEIKVTKILFYLDDVSEINKGPLYVIPGTQNIYDKYSSTLANNVMWPPNWRNNSGGSFNKYNNYLNDNMPKKYILSNQDKIILFNNSILHGSDGNLINNQILRRAIGMTIISLDRTNAEIMKSIDNLHKTFNVRNKETFTYKYCEKNIKTCGNWIDHFYDYDNNFECDFQQSKDGTDTNAITQSFKTNRLKSYTDFMDNNNDELINSNIYNCFKNQINNYII